MSKTIAVTSAIGVVAILGATFFATTRNAEDPFQVCNGAAVAGGAVGGPFTLVRDDGQTVTDADVITEPTIVYFGYTFCPDVCPLDSARNAAAVDILAEQGISATPLFISVDPDRDTVDVVREYADNFHDRMIGLTGSAEQVKAAAQAYKMFYKKADDDPEFYLVDHSTFTYLALPGLGVVDFFNRDDAPEVLAERTACAANVAAGMN